MHEGSQRAVLAALFANLGIAVAKFAAFLATGAASMLAEAVHSVADSANQGLLLLGAQRAAREPSASHPFGYGAERFFWAFVVAVVLFLLGGVFAVSEGIEKLRHPHEIVSPGWGIGVLVVAIVLESFSLRTAVIASNAVRGGVGWWQFVRRAKSPELPVVLLEDLGALLGLVFALAGLLLATTTGSPAWDAAGSIAIGVLLCVISLVLSIEMKSLLIGESASQHDLGEIRAALESAPQVRRLIHLRTLQIGPDELFVGAKIEFEAGLDLAGVARAIDLAEARVRARVTAVALMYLEPDLHRAGPGAGGG